MNGFPNSQKYFVHVDMLLEVIQFFSSSKFDAGFSLGQKKRRQIYWQILMQKYQYYSFEAWRFKGTTFFYRVCYRRLIYGLLLHTFIVYAFNQFIAIFNMKWFIFIASTMIAMVSFRIQFTNTNFIRWEAGEAF